MAEPLPQPASDCVLAMGAMLALFEDLPLDMRFAVVAALAAPPPEGARDA
jgi:hypothetical protein